MFAYQQSTDHERQKLQSGSKSINHSEKYDLVTLLKLIYSFSETSAALIYSGKKWNQSINQSIITPIMLFQRAVEKSRFIIRLMIFSVCKVISPMPSQQPGGPSGFFVGVFLHLASGYMQVYSWKLKSGEKNWNWRKLKKLKSVVRNVLLASCPVPTRSPVSKAKVMDR